MVPLSSGTSPLCLGIPNLPGNPVIILAMGTNLSILKAKIRKKRILLQVMVISRRLYGLCIQLAVMLFAAGSVSAQVLPLLNSFRSRTFDGTVNVSWPVEFDGCTFLTDSVVLSHSYGAVFRNCRFESRSGKLYMAESGSGMIMAGCEVTGCDGFSFSRHPGPADRNYVTDVTVNGSELDVLEEQESVIEIDGLGLAGSVEGVSHGPLLMLMSAQRNMLKAGETSTLQVRGLEEGKWV